jgi:hypothetical protein
MVDRPRSRGVGVACITGDGRAAAALGVQEMGLTPFAVVSSARTGALHRRILYIPSRGDALHHRGLWRPRMLFSCSRRRSARSTELEDTHAMASLASPGATRPW